MVMTMTITMDGAEDENRGGQILFYVFQIYKHPAFGGRKVQYLCVGRISCVTATKESNIISDMFHVCCAGESCLFV